MSGRGGGIRKKETKNTSDVSGDLQNIIYCVEQNNIAGVDAILRQDPTRINEIHESTGMTGLHLCAGDGNIKMLLHLLSKHGSDATIRDKFGRSALDMAINIGRRDVIDALFEAMYPRNRDDFTIKLVPQ